MICQQRNIKKIWKKKKINEDIIDQLNDEELEKRFDIIVHNVPRYNYLPADWDNPKDDI